MSSESKALLDIFERLSPEGKRAIRENALRRLRAEIDRQDLVDARAALKEAEEKGTIPLEEARKRLGL